MACHYFFNMLTETSQRANLDACGIVGRTVKIDLGCGAVSASVCQYHISARLVYVSLYISYPDHHVLTMLYSSQTIDELRVTGNGAGADFGGRWRGPRVVLRDMRLLSNSGNGSHALTSRMIRASRLRRAMFHCA